ncbi:hypothetical protein RCO27_10515 [Sphingosinicella sp. LHD-64]|uniref:hypothetical protein n=1 Tax=Sphingosinicella sp. LHD-64 TaxID=3072139 RepID=UPI002810132A|nr:hypothetical protein [Sphingosinicella sp. LHD-64]MDQ8756666.1 hypothetical protein [Sphingosinicella sp. LHD-64]
MTVADPLRVAIGILFVLLGIGMLLVSHGTRGFNQRRQAAALALLGGGFFLVTGLGLVEL